MMQIVGKGRMHDRILVTPKGRMAGLRCPTPPEDVDCIRAMRGGTANVYPGGAYWVSVAEAMVAGRQ